MEVEINLIDWPKVWLRPVVEDSPALIEMERSIQQHQILCSLLVRPRGDRYELVDGAYRLTAAKKLGLTTVPVLVKELTDEEALAAQVACNAVRSETSTIDYARHLLRIQHSMPDITQAELAKLVGKSSPWIRQQLGLLRLEEPIQKMVDRGTIPLLNAYELSRLPPGRQIAHVQDAIELPPPSFKSLAAEVVQEVMVNAKDRSEAHRTQRAEQLCPYLRPLKDLVTEAQLRHAGAAVIVEARPTTVLEAFTLGVKWAINIDPLSLRLRREAQKNS